MKQIYILIIAVLGIAIFACESDEVNPVKVVAQTQDTLDVDDDKVENPSYSNKWELGISVSLADTVYFTYTIDNISETVITHQSIKNSIDLTDLLKDKDQTKPVTVQYQYVHREDTSSVLIKEIYFNTSNVIFI